MKYILFFFSLLLVNFFISGQEINPTVVELEKLTVRERVDPPRGVEEEKPSIQRFAGEEPRETQTEVRNHFLPFAYRWLMKVTGPLPVTPPLFATLMTLSVILS